MPLYKATLMHRRKGSTGHYHEAVGVIIPANDRAGAFQILYRTQDEQDWEPINVSIVPFKGRRHGDTI